MNRARFLLLVSKFHRVLSLSYHGSSPFEHIYRLGPSLRPAAKYSYPTSISRLGWQFPPPRHQYLRPQSAEQLEALYPRQDVRTPAVCHRTVLFFLQFLRGSSEDPSVLNIRALLPPQSSLGMLRPSTPEDVGPDMA